MLGSTMLRLTPVASTFANPLKSPASMASKVAAWLRSGAVEVWLRFLFALLGLSLAFLAAIFSTVLRDTGHVWGTVLLASLSLILAAFVGLVTVPYLARRITLERIRESFDYEVTRGGIVYVLLTLVIAIAALNTGNNLLYIVVAAMLAAILVSGVASAIVLRRLELDIRLPEHVFAGRPLLGRIVLHNPRRWLPSFSIRVLASRKLKQVSEKRWRWEPTTFAFPANRPPERQWLRLPDRRLRRVKNVPPPPGIFDGSVYFLFLPPGSELSANLELNFERRGRYRDDNFGLATRFPFAFLTKTRHVSLAREVVVYPRIQETDEFFEILPLIRGEWETFVRGRGLDLYLIREYMPEDSARHVDWKATAKSGSLKVREFAREDERKLSIIFDNPHVGAIAPEAYENAVSLAASLAWHFSSQDADVSFAIPGRPRTQDVYDFLRWLAVIEPGNSQHGGGDRDVNRDGVASNAASQLSPADLMMPGEYNIVLTARPRGSLPNNLWNSSYFVFLAEASQRPR
jgi:uncharacterized protein (DUF58 family)